MSIEPEFMRRLSEFRAERARVRTVDDWRAFTARWFDSTKWPKKSPAQLATESFAKRAPLDLGGRRWSHTTWAYDLTPEARYEYFAARHEVGLPLLFSVAEDGRGVTQACPFDEISTPQIGDETCPRCGRRLLYVRVAD
jgi:hypothetical protein